MSINRNLSRSGLIIILTGGIATGKSFVLKYFQKLGYATESLDNISRKLLEQNSAAYDMIASSFPRCINHNKQIDKALLSRIVFQDNNQLSNLTAILHPFIRKEYERIIELYRKYGRSIVIEVPLMIEALTCDNYCYSNDAIILIEACYETKLKRALLRKNMTKEKFDAIVSLQLQDEYKEQYADFIIRNECSLAALGQIKRFLHGRFERDSFRY